MTKVLVLGATGFIGGHIAQAALAAGWEVSGMRRDATRTGFLGELPVKWVTGNLENYAALQAAMETVDLVFHAAAFYPKDGNPRKVSEQIAYAQQEIRNVIAAARQAKVKKFIYTSTLTTIGHPTPKENRLADERDFYIPGMLAKSGYYEAKIEMEKIFLEACAVGFPGVILNPTAVFGPGDVHLTMGSLLIAVAKGWLVGWLPGEINVVDGRDVAQAHIAAVEHGLIGERYIIGGHNYTVREALEIAARVAGAKLPRFKISGWALRGLTTLGDVFPFLPLPSNHLRAIHLWQGYNTHKAEQVLGFQPRPFTDTVQDSLNWFREEGMLT
jgi:dihydroflavonol-4-reductase